MIEHPLTPLTADEISTAASCVKAQSGLDDNAFFETITLDEPDHDEMAAFRANGTRPTRRAYVCCYERSSNRTLRGVVDLGAERLVSGTMSRAFRPAYRPKSLSSVMRLPRPIRGLWRRWPNGVLRT